MYKSIYVYVYVNRMSSFIYLHIMYVCIYKSVNEIFTVYDIIPEHSTLTLPLTVSDRIVISDTNGVSWEILILH